MHFDGGGDHGGWLVSGLGWALTDISAIPSLWNVGKDGVAIDEEAAYELIGKRDPGIVDRWNEMERRYPGYDDQVDYHSIRQHFGIRAFGVAAWTAPAGQCVVPPHSETAAGYHQEELYLVVRGSARILCDGDEVTLAAGHVLFVAPEVFREGVALETPTTVLVVGGRPGAAYEPPTFALDRTE
jgi:mannose-6-phosphate isomerase-like protein (cupin superfamily)